MIVPQYIKKIYKNYSGFGLHKHDKLFSINSDDVHPTYGEILPESVSTMIANLNITKNDVFYDLGSGTGKVVVQFYLETPVKKAVGIELGTVRHEIATDIETFIKNKFESKYKQLNFINDNFLNVDTTDGTIFYLCSTCFTDELMNKLYHKIKQSSRLKYIITLRELDTHVKPVKILLPTTWNSQGSPTYFYNFRQ
jgi:hypothetical protein